MGGTYLPYLPRGRIRALAVQRCAVPGAMPVWWQPRGQRPLKKDLKEGEKAVIQCLGMFLMPLLEGRRSELDVP